MRNDEKLLAAIAALPLAFEQMSAELATGLQSFHNGVPLQAARYVPVGAAGGRSLACAAAGRLVGWSLRATGGPVTVVLRDSRTEAGDAIAYVELADNDSETVWLGPGGVSFVEGLYVQTVSAGAGVIQGAVWLGAVD